MEKFKDGLTKEDADRGSILVQESGFPTRFEVFKSGTSVAKVWTTQNCGWNIENTDLDNINVSIRDTIYRVKDGYDIIAYGDSLTLEERKEEVVIYDSTKHSEGVKSVNAKEKVRLCPVCESYYLASNSVEVHDNRGNFYKLVDEDCYDACVATLSEPYRPR